MTIFIGLVTIALATAPRAAGGDRYNVMLWTGIILVVIGIGALLGRKITAALFAMESVVYAGLFITPCFKLPPHPTMIFAIVVATLCLLPVIYTIRGWQALK